MIININHTQDNSHSRRIDDNSSLKNRTHSMNLERRIEYNERRKRSISNYTGPARRFNIDRRMRSEDRRD